MSHLSKQHQLKLYNVINTLCGEYTYKTELIRHAIGLIGMNPDPIGLTTNMPLSSVLKDIIKYHKDQVEVLTAIASAHKISDDIMPNGLFSNNLTGFVIGHNCQFYIRDPVVKVMQTKIGLGVVAKCPIKKHRVVAVYPRHVINLRTNTGMEGSFTRDENQRVQDDRYKLSGMMGNHTWAHPNEFNDGKCGHMINGSDGSVTGDTNCIIVSPLNEYIDLIVTLCDIDVGDELLMDYGMDYWNLVAYF